VRVAFQEQRGQPHGEMQIVMWGASLLSVGSRLSESSKQQAK
jgi:hypothetical protein